MADELEAAERELLRQLAETADRGGFAMACDGRDRPLAHRLTKAGLAEWKGESFGSSFWAITAAGRACLAEPARA